MRTFAVAVLVAATALSADAATAQTAQYSVTAQAPGQMERGVCVGSGAGPAAGFACGDLLVAHAMPVFRALNREHSLAMLYVSGTVMPRPYVMADIRLVSGSAADSLRLILSVNNVRQDSARMSSIPAGPPRRVTLRAAADTFQTGIQAAADVD